MEIPGFHKVLCKSASGYYYQMVPNDPPVPKQYKYRSLPCSAGDWSVCGFDSLLNGGGVLEWCFDKPDAISRIAIMRGYPQFQDLSIGSPEETKIPVYEWCSGNIRPVLWEQIDNGRSLENVRR